VLARLVPDGFVPRVGGLGAPSGRPGGAEVPLAAWPAMETFGGVPPAVPDGRRREVDRARGRMTTGVALADRSGRCRRRGPTAGFRGTSDRADIAVPEPISARGARWRAQPAAAGTRPHAV